MSMWLCTLRTIFLLLNFVYFLIVGNHWLATTVNAIVMHDNLDSFVSNGTSYSIYPLEFSGGFQAYLSSTRPRIAHTNMTSNYLPRGLADGKGKLIHISRNPRDIAVSYFHFVQIDPTGYGVFDNKWDTFFDCFMAGRVSNGRWYDHMIDWTKHKNKDNILFVTYEDFKDDPQSMIQNLAKFIGKPITEDQCRRIADIISFKAMKSHPKMSLKHERLKGDFLRKGVVGDWQNYFTTDQESRINEMYEKFKSETGVSLRFK